MSDGLNDAETQCPRCLLREPCACSEERDEEDAIAPREGKIRYMAGGLLNELAHEIKEWREGMGFVTTWKRVPEKLMLAVCELAEAMEAHRDLPDEAIQGLDSPAGKMPCSFNDVFESGGNLDAIEKAYDNFKEEIADTVIRLLDLSASLNFNIEHEIHKKMLVNDTRPQFHGRCR